MTTSRRIVWSAIGFAGLIQLQNAWYYAPGKGEEDAGLILLRLPFLSLAFVIGALLIGALYRASADRRPLKWTFWPVWLAYHALLVVDQLSYALFTHRTDWALARAEVALYPLSTGALLGEALATLGWMGLLNLLCLLVLTAWLWHGARASQTAEQPEASIGRFGRIAFATYAIICALVLTGRGHHRLGDHPLVSIARSAGQSVDAPYSQLLARRLHKPVHGTPIGGGAQPELEAARAALRRRAGGRRPDLLLCILESVGTHQLIASSGRFKGKVSSRATPFIAELARTSVRFDALYPSFPSSARSHIPMMSGGPTITWGRYNHYFDYRYRSQNLISELASRGYRTGVFATGDLAVERMGHFYAHLAPTEMAHYNDARQSMDPKRQLNYWGVDSDEARRVAMQWVKQQPADQPVALIFMTVETHHPYSYPATHQAPLVVRSLLEKYYNALHYTDAALRRLVADLHRAGREDLIVALTGDHGEAFGKRHGNNFLHRDHLYEENLREFLLIADPKRLSREVVSHRVGQIGDLGPTLLDALDGTARKMPGQSLFPPEYEMQVVFFHKVTDPYRWGLRDGQWKFISSWPTREPQLYDLAADPYEQSNLASRYPQRVAHYHELCATWYLRTGYDFISRLEGYRLAPGAGRRRSQLERRPWGAIGLTFGRRDEAEAGQPLDPSVPLRQPTSNFAPEDRILWRVRWAPWKIDQKIKLVLVRQPDGVPYEVSFVLPRGDAATVAELVDLPRPLVPGRYQLSLSLVRRGSDRPLITGTFDVGSRRED